jgi:2-dehydropantoate 2-reductase
MLSNSRQPLKILIFGAGAIGTYVGGSLVLMGHQVVFLEQPAVVEDLRQRGLRLDLSVDKRREGQDAAVIPPASVVFAPPWMRSCATGPSM